jgi:tetratricopeptide (TPR) repeat protein
MGTHHSISSAIAGLITSHPWLSQPARALVRVLRALKRRASIFAGRHPRLAIPMRKLFLALGGASRSDFFARANALANSGRHVEAVAVLEAGLAHHRHHMQAHETLIQVLVHLQQYERALNACIRALEVGAESNSLLASLNVILSTLRSTQRPEDVIQALTRCVAVIPQNFDVVVLLLELLVKLKRFREAVQACELALRLDPEFLPALEILEKMEKDPAARNELTGIQLADIVQLSDGYRQLVAKNVADFLFHMMGTFYRKLGTDPLDVPLVQGLERFRQKFSPRHEEDQPHQTATLIPFERAWGQYQGGNVTESLSMFEAILRDPVARKKTVHNPYVKVAVIRSGEILGRHYDTQGRTDLAITTYRDILSLDHNSIIAGRLLVLLARSGDLRAAANLAEEAIVSRPNLYPRLPDSAYVAALKEEIARR